MHDPRKLTPFLGLSHCLLNGGRVAGLQLLLLGGSEDCCGWRGGGVAFCWEEDCGGGAAPLVTGEEMKVERGG